MTPLTRILAPIVAAALLIPWLSATAGASTLSWQPISKAPIPGRISEGVVWTGKRMIVWGGVSGAYEKEARSDGAAYDPATDSWRRIATSPPGVIGGGGQAAAWTGRRAVFWAGNAPDGPARGAVYDPRTDRWDKLPKGPLGTREGYLSAWTGKELIIIGGSSGDALVRPFAAAIDPRADSWRRLPGLNHLGIDGLLPSGVIWSGDRLFIGGTAYECPQGQPCTSRPIFLSYDVATDEADEIDLASAPAPSIAPIGWTGTNVFATGRDAASVVLYDPSTDTWQSGTAAPCSADTSGYGQTAWLDGRYVMTCGRKALQIYSVASDTWDRVRAGRSPFNSRAGSAIVSTGTDLVAWSGIAARPGNPTPNSGMSIGLSAAT